MTVGHQHLAGGAQGPSLVTGDEDVDAGGPAEVLVDDDQRDPLAVMGGFLGGGDEIGAVPDRDHGERSLGDGGQVTGEALEHCGVVVGDDHHRLARLVAHHVTPKADHSTGAITRNRASPMAPTMAPMAAMSLVVTMPEE